MATTRLLTRLLLIALLIETGAVLIVVPWSAYWERNLFFDLLPALEGPLQNHFTRGAISGLGVVNACAGLVDLASLVVGRVAGRTAHASAPADAREGDGQLAERPRLSVRFFGW